MAGLPRFERTPGLREEKPVIQWHISIYTTILIFALTFSPGTNGQTAATDGIGHEDLIKALPQVSTDIVKVKSRTVPPILEKIAFCESSGKHFDENGEVVRGKYNQHDIGKYQINTLYWGDEAEKLGHDLMTEEGNEAMAIAMYEKYGTKPWNWSKPCWDRPVVIGMNTQ